MQNEKIKGWIGSIIVHAVIVVILLLVHVSLDLELPEFVEVSWGTPAPREPVRPVETQPARSVEREPIVMREAVSPPAQRPVTLPERRMPLQEEEVIQVPDVDKLAAAQNMIQDERREEEMRDRRDRDAGAVFGERERFDTSDIDAAVGESPVAVGGPTDRIFSDRDVSYALEWVGDITRRKIAGDLPDYPSGVNVEAVIRLRATVLPDGSVKAIRPTQKGDTRLEEAAMRAVRYWRFEPLARNQPQVEQDCFITFLFTLQ